MGLDKFIGNKGEFIFPICNECKHRLPGNECKAFVKIPDSILEGGKHDKVFPNQVGNFVFEKAT